MPPGIFIRIGPLLPARKRRRERARRVLGAGEQIDAHVIRRLHVRPAIQRGVGESRGAAAAPILRRGVGVEDFRPHLRCEMGLQPVGLASDVIAAVGIQIRKPRGFEIAQSVRPCEAGIEIAAAGGTRDVRDDAVECPLPGFIGVEALIKDCRNSRPSWDGPNAIA